MDLRTEGYEALDDTATQIWLALHRANGDVGQTLASLSRHYRCEREQLAEPVLDFLAACRERGFLSDQPDAPAPLPVARLRLPLRLPELAAWCTMAWLSVSLRRRGFARLYRALGRYPIGQMATVPAITEDRALSAFLLAENAFWFRRAPRDCLPRSLALYVFLRSLGLPVTHRIGGRRFPGFVMHAWVEHAGQPLLDDGDKIATYTVLATLPQE